MNLRYVIQEKDLRTVLLFVWFVAVIGSIFSCNISDNRTSMSFFVHFHVSHTFPHN